MLPSSQGESVRPGKMSLQKNRQCAKDREGHAKDNVKGMKWKQVLLLAGFYSLVSFFTLSSFQEFFFRALLIGGWDGVPQTCRLIAFIADLCLLILGPALSSTLPSAPPSLWASSPLQAENIHPLVAFFASTFSLYSGPPRKSTPALEYFKGLVSSVSSEQYFCFLGVGGYIFCYHESETLQGKVRRHGWVLARAIAQGIVSFLMAYHLKISNVFVVFFLGQHCAQLCQVCWLREICWVAKRSCHFICQQQHVFTTVGV